MSNSKNECPITGGGCDKVSTLLSKVGITRSLLVTLALVPFAWSGASFVVNAVVGAWNAIASKITSGG